MKGLPLDPGVDSDEAESEQAVDQTSSQSSSDGL
jgi:hypothetical protein